MMNQQPISQWNNSCPPINIDDSELKSFSERSKRQRFEVQTVYSPSVSWRGLEAKWEKEKQTVFPQQEEISPEALEAIALLDSWTEEDKSEEQKETWDYLMKAIDEDRLSDRKFFFE